MFNIILVVFFVYLINAFIERKQRFCCFANLGCALLLPRSRALWWLFRWSGKPSTGPERRPYHGGSTIGTISDSWGVRASVISDSSSVDTTSSSSNMVVHIDTPEQPVKQRRRLLCPRCWLWWQEHKHCTTSVARQT